MLNEFSDKLHCLGVDLTPFSKLAYNRPSGVILRQSKITDKKNSKTILLHWFRPYTLHEEIKMPIKLLFSNTVLLIP